MFRASCNFRPGLESYKRPGTRMLIHVHSCSGPLATFDRASKVTRDPEHECSLMSIRVPGLLQLSTGPRKLQHECALMSIHVHSCSGPLATFDRASKVATRMCINVHSCSGPQNTVFFEQLSPGERYTVFFRATFARSKVARKTEGFEAPNMNGH